MLKDQFKVQSKHKEASHGDSSNEQKIKTAMSASNYLLFDIFFY